MAEAARKNWVVLKGMGRFKVFWEVVTLTILPWSFFLARTFSASAFSQNRPALCSAKNSLPALSNKALTTQYFFFSKAFLSFSRLTIKARVGVCTRPALKNSLPSRPEMSERKRVKAAPQTRSISRLALAESAKG